MIGVKYGSLTILCYVAKRAQKNNKRVMCICDCGKSYITSRCDLRSGHTKTCGCSKHRVKHGLYGTGVYNTWHWMVDRCSKSPHLPQYKRYAGRGISVCSEWRDPVVFCKWALANGWAEGLHIDRINNDGDYCPSNCRFVTQAQNNCNRGMQQNNTSGLICVTKRKNRFESRLGTKSLGYYKTKEDAISARNNYITENNLFYYNLQRCA